MRLSPVRGRLSATLALVAAVSLLPACGPKTTKPERRSAERVFVIGFDGMDPTLTSKFMAEGKLPNLQKLANSGTYRTLGTTQPSESPVAWASFATGVNPGKHNIYDFLIRDFDTYMPDLAMVKKEPPEFLWGSIPIKRPKAISTRGGTSFWVTAGLDGVRSKVLTVPVTFPPEEVEHGELLAGLPLPDLRGTVGTFYYWSTDLSSFEEGSPEFGGYLKRLLFDGGVSKTYLRGPESPILKQEEAALRAKQKDGALSEKDQARLTALKDIKDVNVPITVNWTENSGKVDLDVQGTKLSLKQGEWSGWVPLTFNVNFLVKLHGMTQFFIQRADSELQIYAHPANMDPRNPPIAITKPERFAQDLVKKIGVYRTIGWAESMDKSLQELRTDEASFLYDADKAFDDREKIILENLKDDNWDLFVAAIETTDRVSHMFFRLIDPKHPMYDKDLAAKYGDAIEKVYRRADALVGKLQEKLPKNTTFMVMSDHGFHTFRRGVNLNTWLVQHGYMVFDGQESPKKGLDDLFGRGQFWEGVDWSRTRAYAVGLGQIYFNLKGRESRGIVSPGAEYDALQKEIGEALAKEVDPDDKAQIFRSVYKRDEIYKGEYLRNAPDLQVGFNDGYRVGWQDTMGGVQRTFVENNNRKWSGDHCATATEISGGVFFSSRKVANEAPHIMDLAPTVLELLGVPLPKDYDGKPLR
ncbi:MAG TPA: alkaline phosphatase family protein [Vicinamibacteria bacterium]|nr:alkaline phosphatase family protein [Vicinamibacteria bacterium]HRB12076.1 alkaline phosphatase family protein [Vicinamibacteria bacterium]